MKSLQKFAVAGAVAVASLVASDAQAASFTLQSYSVSAFNETSNNGLDIDVTNVLAANTSFNLTTVGQSVSFGLFNIGTTETSIEGDDETNRPISVSFTFSAPAPGFGGLATGTTDGFVQLFTDCGFFAGGCGRVEWTNPTIMTFNGGVLGVVLENDTFSTPGSALINVRFELLRIDPTTPAAVPEPASMLLLGTGLAGLAARARRRKKA